VNRLGTRLFFIIKQKSETTTKETKDIAMDLGMTEPASDVQEFAEVGGSDSMDIDGGDLSGFSIGNPSDSDQDFWNKPRAMESSRRSKTPVQQPSGTFPVRQIYL